MSTSAPSQARKTGIYSRFRHSYLLKGVLSVGALRLLSLPLTLATAMLLARLLGAEDYGRYAFAVSLATLLSLPVGQGVTQLLTREIAQGVQQDRHGVHPGIMAWAWRRLCLYALILLALTGAVWGLFQIGGLAWGTAILLAPLVAAYQIYGGAIRGHGAPVPSQIPEMVIRPLCVLLLIASVWALASVSLVNALLLHILATGIGLWVSWLICHRISPAGTAATAAERHDGAWTRSSLSFTLIAATNFLTIEIGILALGVLGQPEQVAGMRIAQSGAQIVMLSLVAVDVVTQPRIAVLAREQGIQMLRHTYVRAARLAFGVALSMALVLIILQEPLVRLAFGQEFVPLTRWPLTILAAMGVAHAFFGASGTLLNMAGREKQTLRAQALALTVTIVGVIGLAPDFGATGAASAVAMGMVIKKLAEAIYIKTRFGVFLHALSSQAGALDQPVEKPF